MNENTKNSTISTQQFRNESQLVQKQVILSDTFKDNKIQQFPNKNMQEINNNIQIYPDLQRQLNTHESFHLSQPSNKVYDQVDMSQNSNQTQLSKQINIQQTFQQNCIPLSSQKGCQETQIKLENGHHDKNMTKSNQILISSGNNGFVGGGLQNLKQNQNLFLSLQSKDDRLNRWKYTLLVLDNMINQILGVGPYKGYEIGFWGSNSNQNKLVTKPLSSENEAEIYEVQDGEIDFVKIAENLPKLAINMGAVQNQDDQNNVSHAGKVQDKTIFKASEIIGKKVQRISLQPRICSKLWEALRKCLREQFKMELEFFDQSRLELVQNFHIEALQMFKKRLLIYIQNQDLLILKQENFAKDGQKFVEKEIRAQRLIEQFCVMCEQQEQNGLQSKRKLTFIQIGEALQDELKKQDKITDEEWKDIRATCEELSNGENYDQLQPVLNKLFNEIMQTYIARQKDISKTQKLKWTELEIAQLLIAVFNIGEGDWIEIQKRINFQSSGIIKNANQVAQKYQTLKRVMRRDLQKLRRKFKGEKIINKQDWILQALKTLNIQIQIKNQKIAICEEGFSILENSVMINPNDEFTPYQKIIQKFHIQQQKLHEQRVQKAQRSQIRQLNASNNQNQFQMQNKSENKQFQMYGQKQSFSQRFGISSNDQDSNFVSKIQKVDVSNSQGQADKNYQNLTENSANNQYQKNEFYIQKQDEALTKTKPLSQGQNYPSQIMKKSDSDYKSQKLINQDGQLTNKPNVNSNTQKLIHQDNETKIQQNKEQLSIKTSQNFSIHDIKPGKIVEEKENEGNQQKKVYLKDQSIIGDKKNEIFKQQITDKTIQNIKKNSFDQDTLFQSPRFCESNKQQKQNQKSKSQNLSYEQSEINTIKQMNSSKDSNIDIPLQVEMQIESDNISFKQKTVEKKSSQQQVPQLNQSTKQRQNPAIQTQIKVNKQSTQAKDSQTTQYVQSQNQQEESFFKNHITINNNITITTIHNSVQPDQTNHQQKEGENINKQQIQEQLNFHSNEALTSTAAAAAVKAAQTATSESIMKHAGVLAGNLQSLNSYNKNSITSLLSNGSQNLNKQKSNNIGLLLQNPLSQIQAPLQIKQNSLINGSLQQVPNSSLLKNNSGIKLSENIITRNNSLNFEHQKTNFQKNFKPQVQGGTLQVTNNQLQNSAKSKQNTEVQKQSNQLPSISFFNQNFKNQALSKSISQNHLQQQINVSHIQGAKNQDGAESMISKGEAANKHYSAMSGISQGSASNSNYQKPQAMLSQKQFILMRVNKKKQNAASAFAQNLNNPDPTQDQ